MISQVSHVIFFVSKRFKFIIAGDEQNPCVLSSFNDLFKIIYCVTVWRIQQRNEKTLMETKCIRVRVFLL